MTSSIDSLAAQIQSLQAEIRAIKTTPQLAYSSIVDGAIEGWTGDGTQTMVIGDQYDGSHGAVAVTGPTPPKPSRPVLTPVPGGITVMWDGTYDTGDPTTVAPMDWARVDLVASVDPNFDAIATPPVNSFQSPRGGEIFVPGQAGITYNFALVTRSFPGKASVSSERASEQPLPIAGGEGAPSDGMAPQSAPGIHATPGERSIFIKIDAVTNADPVTYDIYASTATPVPYDAANLVGSTPSTLAVVSAMTDGAPVSTSAPTYFMAVARDADGAGPQSAEASTTAKATPTAADLQGLADTSSQAAQDAADSATAAQAARDDATAAQTAATAAQQAADAAASDSSTSAEDAAAAQAAAVTAQQAAAAAEARATTAEQNAADSATAAGQAATSANGTSRVWYLDTVPPTTGRTNKQDDTWFQTADVDGSTRIVAVYLWDSAAGGGSGAWIPRALNHEAIASLDAGKIVTGEMDAIHLKASTVTAREVAAGSIGTNEISADYAYLGDVTAEQIKSGSLQAAIALLGSMTVGDPVGRHITLDPSTGFALYGSDGRTLVQFPVATDGMNTFDGNLTARGFTALDGATFLGFNNIIGANSTFTLASGVTAPTSYPVVDTNVTTSIPGAADWLGSFGSVGGAIGWNGTEFFATDDWSGSVLRFFNPATQASRSVTLSLYKDNYSSGAVRSSNTYLYSPIYLGGFYYMFLENPLYDVSSANATNHYVRYVGKFDASGNQVSQWEFTTWSTTTGANGMFPAKPGNDPAMATDGVSLYTAQTSPSTKNVQIRRFDNPTNPTASNATVTSNVPLAAGTTDHVAQLACGTFDMGGAFCYFVRLSGSSQVTYLYSDGVVGLLRDQTTWTHPATNFLAAGFAWWPTENRFVCVSNGGTQGDLVKMSTIKSINATTGGSKAAFSWYDSVGTTHETKVGPQLAYTRQPRYGVRITVPVPVPGGQGPEDPNTSIIYAADGTSSPLAQVVVGSTVTILDATPTGGKAPSPTTTFLDANASALQSSAGGFIVRGDGSGEWPMMWEPGDIKASGRDTPRAGWLLCDGGYYSKTGAYAALFAAIGHKYNNNVDPGNGTFRVPDLRDRGPVGASATKALGSVGGAASVQLIEANLPPHAHTINHDHPSASTSSDGDHDHFLHFSTGAGGSQGRPPQGTTTDAGTNRGPIDNDGIHNHTVDIPNYTGSSGNGNGSSQAVAVQDPYQTVNWFIRY